MTTTARTKGKLIKRVWRAPGPTGRKIRKVSFGYSIALADGRQERIVKAEWSRDDAEAALVARRDEIQRGQIEPSKKTFREFATEYLAFKNASGKRSIGEDTRIMNKQLVPAFGDTLVKAITEADVTNYHHRRLDEVSAFTVSNELSVLRHALRMAKRKRYRPDVLEFDMPKKPEGRTRYLELDEIARLVDACVKSRNPYLSLVVVLAINTGMRQGEVIGLEREHINLSAAVITVYRTKSKKPRGIPLNQDAYDALIRFQPAAAKRTGYLFSADGEPPTWDSFKTAWYTRSSARRSRRFGFMTFGIPRRRGWPCAAPRSSTSKRRSGIETSQRPCAMRT